MKRLLFPWICLLLILALNGCGVKPEESMALRIAVLPVLDTLPLYIAEAQGYFEEAGLAVEIVPVNSAPERDQLMQAGQIDGMLNELMSTILYNRDGVKVQSIRFARTATADYPVFRILSAPNSQITNVEQLRNIPVAISDGTIIEYTTDRLLEQAGFSGDEIASVSVPKIPDRMSLLMSGELQAANLPDPVASLAIRNGAHLVIDDTAYPEISYSVYTFSKVSLDDKPQAVRAFLAAVEKAVQDINADKTRWRGVLAEKQLIPEAILDSYVLPDYPTAGVPNETQYEDALSWLLDKGLIEQPTGYADHINSSFLPED